MTTDNIKEIIAQGEGNSVEFKRSFTSDLGREMCAFANSSGGKILLGVSDSREIVGISDTNRIRSQIQSIARSVEPPVGIEIECIDSIMCISVPSQTKKPYSFRGKFYVREGANSQRLSRDELGEFYFREGILHFDAAICQRFDLDLDLDQDQWSMFKNRAKIPSYMKPLIALRNLNLINRNSEVTNACAWLLAKNIRDINISAHISCALFMGTSKTKILDRRDFDSDIYTMIDEAVNWVLSKINVEYIINDVRREERPELPISAIREAVINAVVHRNYRSSANIHVYLFSDRLEIRSPGGLPVNMIESDLGSGSAPRNPLLFSMMHQMDLVEHNGSGIRRIRDLCREFMIAEPLFTIKEHFFTVTFFRHGALGKIEVSPSKYNESIFFETYVQTFLDAEVTELDLNKNQVETILRCEHEKTAFELMEAAGRTNRSKFRESVLNPLIRAELVEMTVPDKPRSRNQKYRLTEKGRNLLHKCVVT